MITEIKIPDIGNFSNVEIVEVLVHAGAHVEKEEALLALESEKATIDIPSPHSGKIHELKIEVGQTVSEGDVVLMMDVTEEGATLKEEPQAKQETAPETPAPASETPEEKAPAKAPAAPAKTTASETLITAPTDSSVAPYASPSVRHFSRELGVNLTLVSGTGRKGRITTEDVQQFVKKQLSQPSAVASATQGTVLPAAPAIDFSQFGDINTVPLGRIRRRSGAHLFRCWNTIPHVTQHDDADITDLEAFRNRVKGEAKQKGFGLTVLAFAIKAVVVALKQFPDFNSSLSSDSKDLILKNYYHIGVAVDTPNGLVVPVLRDADQKSIMEIAQGLHELGGRARSGKMTAEDMQGGTFTISSLGGIGGSYFTPIVNSPEVAILGLSRASLKAVYQDGSFVPRLTLPLSLSYDHRVIDGAMGVRFTTFLCGLLQDVRRIML